MRSPLFFTLFTALVFMTSTVSAAEPKRDGLALTVYSNGMGLIKDRRTLDLVQGANTLGLEGISREARPETAFLRPLCKPGFTVTEQAFDFNVVSEGSLLERAVGQEIGILLENPATGEQTTKRARVISVAEGVVLEMDGKIITGLPGRPVFDALPADLYPSPALSAKVNYGRSGTCQAELIYLSDGLSWRADYTIELAPGDAQVDLEAWATVTNTTGTAFPKAKLQVVAGQVNVDRGIQKMRSGMIAMSESAPGQAPRESLGSFHLYDLAGEIDLPDRQTKQIALLSRRGVKAEVEYIARGNPWNYRNRGSIPVVTKPQSLLKFTVKKDQAPLPGGAARVYKRDSTGALQFIGGGHIPNTPVKRPVRLALGSDFDISIERVQTDFTSQTKKVHSFSNQITVRNGKNKDAAVTLSETLPGDWQITKESQAHKKESANLAVWRVRVPAGGEVVVTYSATVRFR